MNCIQRGSCNPTGDGTAPGGMVLPNCLNCARGRVFNEPFSVCADNGSSWVDPDVEMQSYALSRKRVV